MLVPGDRVLVALSGGADSVALLAALQALSASLDIAVCAAHFNHQLRGSESRRDQEHAERTARRLGVPCIVGTAEHLAGTSNLEARARDARYGFLAQVAAAHGCSRIATGHTLDDQAETVLMRLVRGTGWDGVAGIHPVRDGRIIRPLIECSRKEVLAFLEASDLVFCEDSSNTSRRFLRNRVRHDVLPQLQAINPQVKRTLAGLAAITREEGGWLDDYVGVLLGAGRSADGSLSVSALVAAPAALHPRLLRLWLRKERGDLRRLTAAHWQALIALAQSPRPNGRLRLPGGQLVVREYDRLRWCRREVEPAVDGGQLLMPGSPVYLESGWRIAAEFVRPPDGTVQSPPDLWGAVLDANEIPAPLVVRTPQPGDRVRPLGLRGHRKLQDLFVDHKLPLRARLEYPVVECDGEILWVPGMVRGIRALVTPRTRATLRLVAERAGTGIARA